MSFAKRLAEKIVALDESCLDDALLLEIKRGLLDVVGVSLAGALENCTRLATLSVGLTDGPAQLIGHNGKAPTLDAAAVRGHVRREVGHEALVAQGARAEERPGPRFRAEPVDPRFH